jgi:murein L,D-transpeptidase YafK
MSRLRSLTFAMLVLTAALYGCQDALDSVGDKVEHPLPDKLVHKMKAADMAVRSPIMMRIFKEEGVLEVWKQKGNGRFEKATEYTICKWSGGLGPKIREGDRQAPEGYYRIYPAQMNPKSSYYLSFNMGYPNGFDRAHGRTGSNLMVHGACSSAGCYSMTDEQVLEIYAFAREAFRGGQDYFTVAAYPFRMTPENMARHRDSEHFDFWKMLKIGYDQFEITHRPPAVEVCDRRYVFNQVTEDPAAKFNASAACPVSETPASLASAYSAYQSKWNDAFTKAVAKEDKDEARRLKEEEKKAEAEARKAEAEARREARAETGTQAPLGNLFSLPGASRGNIQDVAVPPSAEMATAPDAALQETAPEQTAPEQTAQAAVQAPVAPATPAQEATDVPVPVANPEAEAPVPARSPAQAPAESGKKPFWKVW